MKFFRALLIFLLSAYATFSYANNATHNLYIILDPDTSAFYELTNLSVNSLTLGCSTGNFSLHSNPSNSTSSITLSFTGVFGATNCDNGESYFNFTTNFSGTLVPSALNYIVTQNAEINCTINGGMKYSLGQHEAILDSYTCTTSDPSNPLSIAITSRFLDFGEYYYAITTAKPD